MAETRSTSPAPRWRIHWAGTQRAHWATLAILLVVLTGCTATDTASNGTPTSDGAPHGTTSAGTRPATTAGTATTTDPTNSPAPSTSSSTAPPARTSASAPVSLADPTSGATTSQPLGTSTTGGESAAPCGPVSCLVIGKTFFLPPGIAGGSSGIVPSTTTPDAFFVVDDRRGGNSIVAIRSDGTVIGQITVQGMSAHNAEALTSGPCGGTQAQCIFIGDIGDNNSNRSSISIYRIAEPSLSKSPTGPVPAQKWVYTYPDAPHNAESLILAPDGSLIVITKSTPDPNTGKIAPHRIYRGQPGGGTLKLVRTFVPPNPAVPYQSMFVGTVVTDAAYSNGRVLLLTYDEVVEYIGKPGADPGNFPNWPSVQLPVPRMIQSEGITFRPAGCGYEVTSEEGPGGTQAGLTGVTCKR